MDIKGTRVDGIDSVLTQDAVAFLEKLELTFGETRRALLKRRLERQRRIEEGEQPDFLTETQEIRKSDWRVASCPKDLENRQVEITGPAEGKMMINALNSGANAFMADLEDSLSPTWENVIQGQRALASAVRKELAFTSPEGKSYQLNSRVATLLVRPRGWHLEEKNAWVNGRAMSASLFDFGLTFFHNAQESLKRGSGPYFYLPKMESHLEARLWNDVFVFAQKELGIPQGSIRATVLIETILAAFEMDEILYELREHISGLNAGRWDYIFSAIKKFRSSPAAILPDRSQITMSVPYMRAYTELLVKTCHRRGAHAMGGMAAFIPSRKDPVVNENAMKRVREDKEREVRDGFDGTWVAHPDLVPVAASIFREKLGDAPNQKNRQRPEVQVRAADLIHFEITGGTVSEAGVRLNINVALQYIERWLSGVGAAAIHNLMEDAATAEISRAQLWQWIRHRVKLASGDSMSRQAYEKIRDEEIHSLGGKSVGRLADAARILDTLVLKDEFEDFLTTSAYAEI